MKTYKAVVSEPLMQILQEKRPKSTDILFFADDSNVKIPGEELDYVVGLGHVPLGYFMNSSPDGLLFQNTEILKVERRNHRDMVRKLADLIVRGYEKNNRDDNIIAYVVCNMFHKTDWIYDILEEKGYDRKDFPPIIPVLGRTIETRNGKIRLPRDYDYKQQVGNYSREKYMGSR